MDDESRQGEQLGVCGLCGRDMFAGASVNKHHLVPKTFGGREAVWIHKVCHTKIHSVFTERQLLQHFHTFERLLTNEEIVKYVKWVRKRDPEFMTRHRTTRAKRRR